MHYRFGTQQREWGFFTTRGGTGGGGDNNSMYNNLKDNLHITRRYSQDYTIYTYTNMKKKTLIALAYYYNV